MRPVLRVFLTCLYLLAGVCFSGPVRSHDGHRVRVHVLSKQLRLLKEGGIKGLRLDLPPDSFILDKKKGEQIWEKRLTFHFKRGMWRVLAGTALLFPPFDIKIMPGKKTGPCTGQIDDMKRYYPVPITVTGGYTGPPKIVTTVPLDRYAIDSALAEYGKKSPACNEAVMALAHIIRARFLYFKKRGFSHRGAHFCDLTHCQVYRGTMKTGLSFNDTWTIDHSKLRGPLFFNSTCGGKILTPGIFNSADTHTIRAKDIMYRDQKILCQKNSTTWTRRLSEEDIYTLFSSDITRGGPLTIHYACGDGQVVLANKIQSVGMAPETFRLRINRVRGWNFIRSNNYRITSSAADGHPSFTFTGTGLGHGAGLCQHGALALSRKGHSRYEILMHYYPDISFYNLHKARSVKNLFPYLSYCLFDIQSGTIIKSSNVRLGHRKVPPGSFFKIVMSLYLAMERPDLFNSHVYTCAGRRKGDNNLPEKCWLPQGHGRLKIQGAITHSCNLYFASLYKKIDIQKFCLFFKTLTAALEIKTVLPAIDNDAGESRLYAGLDFRFFFKVRDLIKIFMIVYPGTSPFAEVEQFKKSIPLESKDCIFRAMNMVFIRGTASGDLAYKGPALHSAGLTKYIHLNKTGIDLSAYWGKTSTVIDGTNIPKSYGFFMGGDNTTGIFTLVREGTGHLAARWALKILREQQ